MAPKTTKSSKRKPSTRRLTNVDYFEAVFQKIYADVALRVSEKEQREAEAARVILWFLRGHLVRRDRSPQLKPLRAVIYERLRRLNLERKQNAAATEIQTRWRSHKARSSFVSEHATKRAAAITLQSNYRGYAFRKKFKEERQHWAAVTIQTAQRKRVARKKAGAPLVPVGSPMRATSTQLASLRAERHRKREGCCACQAARVKAMLAERDTLRRLDAAVLLQRMVRGWLVRKWYVKHFDTRACCTCNSLADTEVLICNDCYEVYHLTCAGYTAEHRPLNNKPWFCHFCVSSKARHTVFLHRRRANAPQALVRMHVNNAADLQRLEAMVSVPRSEQEPPTSNKAVKKHNIRLRDSMGAQERLKMCRQKTEQMLAYKAELEQKVRSLEAESNSTYIGPPPPTVAPKEKVIPSVPVLNMEQPPTIPPLGPQDGRGSAESAMSGMSRFSKKSMGSKSIKSIGSKKGGLGGKKKRPLSKRLNDPLHDRKPKFPAYVETRADQLEAGTFSRSEVLRMRVSMKGWNNSTLLGLDSLGALDESPGFRDIVTLMELDEDEELLEDPNPAAGV